MIEVIFWILLLAFIVLAICGYVLKPLFWERLSSVPKSDYQDEKQLLLNQLQQLGSDFLLGKISRADYQQLTKPLNQKLARLK